MCAYIIREGNLYSCGSNDEGLLGHGDYIDRKTFMLVKSTRKFISIYSSDYLYKIALDTEGDIWICYGQVGGDYESTEPSTYFIRVSCDTKFIHITANVNLIPVALDRDGNLWKIEITIVDGKVNFNVTPLTSITKFISIAAGSHLVALDINRNVWSCSISYDSNSSGALGLGHNDRVQNLTLASSEIFFDKISTGYCHTLAIDIDGQLWVCGSNYNGELGLGDNISRNKFTKVDVDIKCIEIAAAFGHSIVLDENGQIWSCGDNRYGQLGVGDLTDRNILTLVHLNTKFTSISAFHFNSMALDENYCLWVAGNNDCYESGLDYVDETITNFTMVPNIKADRLMNNPRADDPVQKKSANKI